MPRKRTGVTTWQEVIRTACRVSHFPAFDNAVVAIVGDPEATALLEAWRVFCALFEAYDQSDDYPWQIDDSDPITHGDG
jgi:hypothetical protein